MNRLNEKELRSAYDEIVRAAQGLEHGQISFLDGVRRLAGMRTLVSRLDHDPDFLLFVAIDSQSDHLPGTAQREQCSAEWLAECDQEVSDLEAAWTSRVRDACDVLVKRFSI